MFTWPWPVHYGKQTRGPIQLQNVLWAMAKFVNWLPAKTTAFSPNKVANLSPSPRIFDILHLQVLMLHQPPAWWASMHLSVRRISQGPLLQMQHALGAFRIQSCEPRGEESETVNKGWVDWYRWRSPNWEPLAASIPVGWVFLSNKDSPLKINSSILKRSLAVSSLPTCQLDTIVESAIQAFRGVHGKIDTSTCDYAFMTYAGFCKALAGANPSMCTEDVHKSEYYIQMNPLRRNTPLLLIDVADSSWFLEPTYNKGTEGWKVKFQKKQNNV